MFTCDIDRCYPTLRTNHAIALLTPKFPDVFKKNNGFWRKALNLIMDKNYVTHNSEIYMQTNGVATTSPVATTLCNLFLWAITKDVITKHGTKIIIQRRYIDEWFVIARSEKDAVAFITFLERKPASSAKLKITWNITDTEAVYLYLLVYKGPRWYPRMNIEVILYIKATKNSSTSTQTPATLPASSK